MSFFPFSFANEEEFKFEKLNMFNGMSTTGLLRQPKWGHLKELHAVIKNCSTPLLQGVQSNFSIGQFQQVKFTKLRALYKLIYNLETMRQQQLTFYYYYYYKLSWFRPMCLKKEVVDHVLHFLSTMIPQIMLPCNSETILSNCCPSPLAFYQTVKM